jgi:hypothetical protein
VDRNRLARIVAILLSLLNIPWLIRFLDWILRAFGLATLPQDIRSLFGLAAMNFEISAVIAFLGLCGAGYLLWDILAERTGKRPDYAVWHRRIVFTLHEAAFLMNDLEPKPHMGFLVRRTFRRLKKRVEETGTDSLTNAEEFVEMRRSSATRGLAEALEAHKSVNAYTQVGRSWLMAYAENPKKLPPFLSIAVP